MENNEVMDHPLKAAPPLAVPNTHPEPFAHTGRLAGGLYTDLANARRFAAEHRNHLLYVARDRRWYVWNDRRWEQDDTSEVQRRAKATVRALYEAVRAEGLFDDDWKKRLGYVLATQSSSRIASMIELAKSEDGVAATLDQFDRDPWLLNVLNGTLDLRTGELREHRREDFITKLAQVEYDPAAVCPEWERFLARIANGDGALIRYLQKICGYALTGDVREQSVFIVHGEGANGKSTFLVTMAGVVGDGYAQHTPTETLLVKRTDHIPNDVARLRGARLVTAAEADCDRLLAEALVKQLTGGDKVTARFLHGEFFEFLPTFKLLLAVNHTPTIKGTDHAIWRRIRLVPFTVTIPEEEQDKTLVEKLRAERPGILRWAVAGCSAWLKEGLEPPAAVKAATSAYREAMDTVAAFIDDCCIKGPDAKTQPSRLYGAYEAWCGASGEPLCSAKEFAARLAEKGYTNGRGNKGRFWSGLAVDTARLPAASAA